MKRYLVFAGDVYYPVGGWLDFVLETDSIEEAVNIARTETTHQEDRPDLLKKKGDYNSYKWSHVIDTATKGIVFPPVV